MKQEFIEDNIMIISKQTMDLFLTVEKPSDCIGLYLFYYYTAKWQETNTVKCTTSFASKGLHWTKEKTISIKKTLIELGLIEDITKKNKNGKINGWYIKVNYIWKQQTVKDNLKNHPTGKPEGGLDQWVEKPDTNALSANSLNALNANSKIDDFPIFWNLYDKKVSQTKCQTKWNKLSAKDKQAILDVLPAYKNATPDKKYRKNPETFLNNRSWEDEILNNKPKQIFL